MGICTSEPKYTPAQETECLKNMIIPIIWIIGPPGSGRSTLCDKLVERYVFWKINVGSIIENRVHQAFSKTGRMLQEILRKNELIPRETIIQLIREEMVHYMNKSSGFIIDGFPKNVDQAIRFEELAAPPSLVIELKCTPAIGKQRILSRYPGRCSLTETEPSIYKRTMEYYTHVGPILEKFAEQIVLVNADEEASTVYWAVRRHVDKLFRMLGIEIPRNSAEDMLSEEEKADLEFHLPV